MDCLIYNPSSDIFSQLDPDKKKRIGNSDVYPIVIADVEYTIAVTKIKLGLLKPPIYSYELRMTNGDVLIAATSKDEFNQRIRAFSEPAKLFEIYPDFSKKDSNLLFLPEFSISIAFDFIRRDEKITLLEQHIRYLEQLAECSDHNAVMRFYLFIRLARISLSLTEAREIEVSANNKHYNHYLKEAVKLIHLPNEFDEADKESHLKTAYSQLANDSDSWLAKRDNKPILDNIHVTLITEQNIAAQVYPVKMLRSKVKAIFAETISKSKIWPLSSFCNYLMRTSRYSLLSWFIPIKLIGLLRWADFKYATLDQLVAELTALENTKADAIPLRHSIIDGIKTYLCHDNDENKYRSKILKHGRNFNDSLLNKVLALREDTLGDVSVVINTLEFLHLDGEYDDYYSYVIEHDEQMSDVIKVLHLLAYADLLTAAHQLSVIRQSMHASHYLSILPALKTYGLLNQESCSLLLSVDSNILMSVEELLNAIKSINDRAEAAEPLGILIHQKAVELAKNSLLRQKDSELIWRLFGVDYAAETSPSHAIMLEAALLCTTKQSCPSQFNNHVLALNAIKLMEAVLVNPFWPRTNADTATMKIALENLKKFNCAEISGTVEETSEAIKGYLLTFYRATKISRSSDQSKLPTKLTKKLEQLLKQHEYSNVNELLRIETTAISETKATEVSCWAAFLRSKKLRVDAVNPLTTFPSAYTIS